MRGRGEGGGRREEGPSGHQDRKYCMQYNILYYSVNTVTIVVYSTSPL